MGLRNITFLLAICFVCGLTNSLMLSQSDAKYARFLIKFGYLSRHSMSSSTRGTYVNDDDFSNALMRWQNFVKVTPTGVLDNATKYVMTLQRCQKKDIVSGNRKRRYTTIGHWPKKHLTYKITKYSSRLSQQEVDSIIFLAFSVWSNAADVTFTKRNGGRTDVEIRFDEIAPRADSHIFGNTNSQHRPTVILLNDDIIWSQDFTTGLPNLFQTASHEIGHLLGLGHTDIQGAMMYPVYDLAIKIFSLHEDDIRGVQDLYSQVKTVSYPGRHPYKQTQKKFQTSLDDFKSKIENAFHFVPDIPKLDMANEFFENGF